MVTRRRIRTAIFAAAVVLLTTIVSVTTPARAAASARTGSLTQLHGKGYCLGGSCGTLRGFTKVSGESGPSMSVQLSSNGRTLFAFTDDPGAIAILARNVKTGKLTQLPGKLGCISAKLRSDCAHIQRLDGAGVILISGNGTQIGITDAGWGPSDREYLYARNPKTGAVRLAFWTDTACVPLFNGGPCLVGRELAGGSTQLSSTTLVTSGYAPGSTEGNVGEIMLWHRTNTKAKWQSTAGTAGCANGDGSTSCLNVPCMNDVPTSILRSADHSKLYVVGGYPDSEDSPESYIATFALKSNGDISSLLGCTQAGTDSTGHGYAALWAQLNPATGQLLLLLGRGNRGDGYAWSYFGISSPDSSGVMQRPVLQESYMGTFNYPASVSLSANGQSLTLVDSSLWDFKVSKSAITPLASPYDQPFSWGKSVYAAYGQARSPDGHFLYLGLSVGTQTAKAAPQIRVYKVN